MTSKYIFEEKWKVEGKRTRPMKLSSEIVYIAVYVAIFDRYRRNRFLGERAVLLSHTPYHFPPLLTYNVDPFQRFIAFIVNAHVLCNALKNEYITISPPSDNVHV